MIKKLLVTSALVAAFSMPAFAAPASHMGNEAKQEVQHRAKDAARHEVDQRGHKVKEGAKHEAKKHEAGKRTNDGKKAAGHVKKHNDNQKKMKAAGHPNHVKEHKGSAKKAANHTAKKEANKHVRPAPHK